MKVSKEQLIQADHGIGSQKMHFQAETGRLIQSLEKLILKLMKDMRVIMQQPGKN